MSKVSNLRQARKRKQREDQAQLAAQNRVRHGRTPAQRQQEAEAQQQARARRGEIADEPRALARPQVFTAPLSHLRPTTKHDESRVNETPLLKSTWSK